MVSRFKKAHKNLVVCETFVKIWPLFSLPCNPEKTSACHYCWCLLWVPGWWGANFWFGRPGPMLSGMLLTGRALRLTTSFKRWKSSEDIHEYHEVKRFNPPPLSSSLSLPLPSSLSLPLPARSAVGWMLWLQWPSGILCQTHSGRRWDPANRQDHSLLRISKIILWSKRT